MLEINDAFEFTAIHYPFHIKNAIRIITGYKTLEEYQNYILENNIELAEIVMPNLSILKLCPNLKHLRIFPSYDALPDFDFSILYNHPEIKHLHCNNKYGDKYQYLSEIDYSLINGLVDLSLDVNNSTLNFNKVKTLKSLSVGSFKGENKDVSDLFCSKQLDTLRLIECKITSLNGVENTNELTCLYLDYNRSLQDISALSKVKSTIKTLRINHCPKVNDFDVLSELENLELLELTGSNILQNLNFLKSMKNLKTLILHMNVKDGNLSDCLSLDYVSTDNHAHYNFKNSELPKNKFVTGNESIEEWRRLE